MENLPGEGEKGGVGEKVRGRNEAVWFKNKTPGHEGRLRPRLRRRKRIDDLLFTIFDW
jgi:hypothetical protein